MAGRARPKQRGRAASKTPDIIVNGRFLGQPVTGVQRVARELVMEMDSLIDRGWWQGAITLACASDVSVESLGLRHIAVERRGRTSGHLWEQLELPGMVGDRLLLCLGNTIPILSGLRRQRVAVMIHDLSYLTHPGAYTLRYRLAHRMMLPTILHRAHPIFTVSNSEAEGLRRLGADPARVLVAQNGGWPGEHNMPEAGGPGVIASAGDGYVLSVGSLSKRKNIERVIQVAVRLAIEDGVRTVILGSGNGILAPFREDIPPEARALITMPGQVPDLATLERYYRGAACLLFPSLYEASPLPPIEAMHFGCPVVASAIPANTERCGSAPLYCDPLDVADILTQVRRVLGDADLRRDLSRRSARQARRYSWATQARYILDQLRQAGCS